MKPPLHANNVPINLETRPKQSNINIITSRPEVIFPQNRIQQANIPINNINSSKRNEEIFTLGKELSSLKKYVNRLENDVQESAKKTHNVLIR